jgi:ankyrin repeat protein
VRPYITVRSFTVPNNPIIYLSISNSCKSAATKMRLKIDRSFWQYGDKSKPNLAEIRAFTHAIPSFSPGAELHFYLERGFVLFDPKTDNSITPLELTITAEYSDSVGTFEESTLIDLNQHRTEALNTDAVADQLDGIKRAIEEGMKSMV